MSPHSHRPYWTRLTICAAGPGAMLLLTADSFLYGSGLASASRIFLDPLWGPVLALFIVYPLCVVACRRNRAVLALSCLCALLGFGILLDAMVSPGWLLRQAAGYLGGAFPAPGAVGGSCLLILLVSWAHISLFAARRGKSKESPERAGREEFAAVAVVSCAFASLGALLAHLINFGRLWSWELLGAGLFSLGTAALLFRLGLLLTLLAVWRPGRGHRAVFLGTVLIFACALLDSMAVGTVNKRMLARFAGGSPPAASADKRASYPPGAPPAETERPPRRPPPAVRPE